MHIIEIYLCIFYQQNLNRHIQKSLQFIPKSTFASSKGNAAKMWLGKFIFSVALIIPFFILKTSTNAKINKEKITEETKVTPAGSAPRTLLAPLTYTWAIPMRYSWHIFNKGCKNSCSNNSLKTYGLIFRLFKKTLRENNI